MYVISASWSGNASAQIAFSVLLAILVSIEGKGLRFDLKAEKREWRLHTKVSIKR